MPARGVTVPMGESEDEPSRIATNRFAFAVVVSSVVVVTVAAGLYWAGLLDPALPLRAVGLTSLPLYAIGIVMAIAIVVWSWERVASFFG